MLEQHRAAFVIEALHRLCWAERFADGDLTDEDPALSRLDAADRQWVRDFHAGELSEYGSLIEVVERRCGPIELLSADKIDLGPFVTSKRSAKRRSKKSDAVVELASRRGPYPAKQRNDP